MSDRDIPSVPVTTLAGLTSLSDLLSELPVSDSLSNANTFCKSLLFHALVASEANNLLSVQDDHLVRQLVNAIEQTNSDNIELRAPYASLPQHGGNQAGCPELLQGIYNYRPTVFNRPSTLNQNHHQTNHSQQQQQLTPSHTEQPPTVSSQQQLQSHNSFDFPNVEPLTNASEAAILHTPRRSRRSAPVEQPSAVVAPKTAMQHHQQQQQLLEQSLPAEAHKVTNTTPGVITATTTPEQLHTGMAFNQQTQQHPQSQMQQQHMSAMEPFDAEEMLLQVQQQQQQQQQQHQMQQHLEQQPQVQAPAPAIQGNFQNVLNLQRQQQLQQQKQQLSQKATPTNNEYPLNQQANMTTNNPNMQQSSPAQAATAPDGAHLQAHQQQLQHHQHLHPQQPQQINATAMGNLYGNDVMSAGANTHLETPPSAEPLQFHNQMDQNVMAPPPLSAAIMPYVAEMTMTAAESTPFGGVIGGGNNKAHVRVCINRVSAADAHLMQQSIKAFTQKSPEMAKKMGLPSTTTQTTATTTQLQQQPHPNHAGDVQQQQQTTSASTSANNTTTTTAAGQQGDTFSQMKADERRTGISASTGSGSGSAYKRKLAVPIDAVPPEQIFSQPKVRRVERLMMPQPSAKCSKEEVIRSQTYQQFMRNMEQIIELLDDTEPPNYEADDVDENVECISSKMLHIMSNDVAKLKAKQVLDSIPKNKLTLLINYAMRNIYLAKNYSASPDDEDDIVDDEAMEKILNAIEACLLVCNIYSTAKDLKFLQEDNISLIIKFIQFQLRETIFPSYDPVYTVKNLKKSTASTEGGRGKKAKQTQQQHNHNRSLQLLYSKSVELMKVFVTLFDKCIFVDTIVLPLSTVAIEPFFVDNIETLQFVCLELVTTIFRKERYDKIRSSILGDILTSIDRLPSSKKNLRPFKLASNSGSIQMVTALVLQLIQCATILPDSLSEVQRKSDEAAAANDGGAGGGGDDPTAAAKSGSGKANHDVIVLKKYDVAISIGGNFLTTFLNKCKSRSNETDFRPLFENFIHDLLATVNKPEWPASELLLSLLGTMLVRYVSDKGIEQSIRLVSLDYLGIVAARLRKDTVESRCKVNIIDSMIKSIKAEQEKEGDTPIVNNNLVLDPEEERTEFLQKILLDFLAVNAQEENLIWDYARHFYLAQWYRDIIYQRRRLLADGGSGGTGGRTAGGKSGGAKAFASRKKDSSRSTRKKRRKRSSSESSESEPASDASSDDANEDDDDGSDDDDVNADDVDGGRTHSRKHGKNGKSQLDHELKMEIFNALEDRKRYLLKSIKPFSHHHHHHTSQHIKTYIDYNNAHLIAQYLATKRPFSQSFDGYLKKIILVVNEPSIAVRTRAMKCLANIVEVDPLVLKRKDMQMGVNQKFLDAAISVREAAVDLVGKFVLSNEELIDQYYDMLSTRILDTGVSVRKRVIKILRDICIEYPDFDKIPEICVKMIRRVNDEEGIQKLVTEVFMKMWFMPCAKNDQHGIQRKINQIIDVVNTAHDTGTTWLEGLLTSIFQPKESMLKMDGSAQEPVKKNTEPPAEIVLACQQLADGLVMRLIELEDTDNARMLGCITTLHLLAKVRPQLLVRHAITIEPYLNIKCHAANAPKFICAVADILEKVVPLVNNASETFLAALEEHLMLLVVSYNQAVVTSCVSCLGALVNKITKNYKLIRDCFSKFYRILENSRNQLAQKSQNLRTIYTPMFRRSLFTIGILMRYFDFKSPEVTGATSSASSSSSCTTAGGGGILPSTICDQVFDCLMYFIQCDNHEISKQALIALGSFCVMNDDYLTRTQLRQYYCDLLRADLIESSIKIICMRNIWIYLTESEMHMHNKEKEWEKQSKTDDLKEMNDVSSGMASRIIQLYLEEILECFLHRDDSVRLWAVKVVQIVLRQGLVHPVRMVPYLICLSTDAKMESAHRADALLKEIDKTYSGFVNMKVQFGLQLCFKLQEILQCGRQLAQLDAAGGGNNNKTGNKAGNYIVRGYVKRETDSVPTALNDFLYTLLRTTKPQRRALVQTVTKQFDDQKTTLRQMLYIADNLAYFPYVVQDEPLYLIHQIDLLISMAGTNLLTTFKECLQPNENGTAVAAVAVAAAAAVTATTAESATSTPLASAAPLLRHDVLEDDDDEEDPDVLFKRLPENTVEIAKCMTAAQACMLLLILKEHLKDMYGLTDGKISRYSPSEQKIYEKAVARKTVHDFNPKQTIDVIIKQQEQRLQQMTIVAATPAPATAATVKGNVVRVLDEKEKMDLVLKYLDFKKLMLKLDPDDAESDEEARTLGADKSKMLNSTAASETTPTSTPATSFLNSTSGGGGGAMNVTNDSDTGLLNRAAVVRPLQPVNNMGIHHPQPMGGQMKEAPSTPTSRSSRPSSVTAASAASKSSTARKQPQRNATKRRKRKTFSSDEEDEADYSEDDYA